MRLAWAAVVLGVGALTFGTIGYALGWNDTGGVRYHSNVVPFLLFAGLALLCSSGVLVLACAPRALIRCPRVLAVVMMAVVAWFLVALNLKPMSALIAVRADIVMGSESQFVDQIIRFRAGQPQYMSAEDANSSPYTPGAPLLTYLIATALGHPSSIPTYRLVQQLYLLITVFFGTLAARELFRFCRPESRWTNLWLLFWVPFLYLMAINPWTNVYTTVLYSDALALAIDAVAFWLLIKHSVTSDDRWLIPMAVVPGLGFLAKQKEAVWAVLYVVYLVLAGRASLRRIVVFGVVAFALVGVIVGTCYAVWGVPFYFWTFEVLSRLHVWLHKLVEQVIASGWCTAMGFVGGFVLLRGEKFQRLLPLWFCWFLWTLAAIYTSGIAFRPAHLGPATMFGAVWLLVGVSTIWPEADEEVAASDRSVQWWRTATLPATLFLLLIGAGILRNGPAVPDGLNLYIAAIEKEFQGLSRDRVLLDTGSWVYLPQNIVMKDRESPVGILYGTGASDLAMTRERIRSHSYDKILARKLPGKGGRFFWDPRIDQALLESYHEVRVIPSPGVLDSWLYPPLLYDISVLEPTVASAKPAGVNR